jgi:hypothetical protein
MENCFETAMDKSKKKESDSTNELLHPHFSL